MNKKLDLEFYRPAKKDFIANLHRRNVVTFEQLNNELSLYCACFGLPVIVAIIFAEEEYPQFGEDFERKKEIVRSFYGYEA